MIDPVPGCLSSNRFDQIVKGGVERLVPHHCGVGSHGYFRLVADKAVGYILRSQQTVRHRSPNLCHCGIIILRAAVDSSHL